MFTRTITKALTASILAGAATFALAPAAQAQDSETRSATVSLTGLNLASDDGVAGLDARIKRAARQVCSTANRLTLAEKAMSASCQRGAIEGAQAPMEHAIALAKSDARYASAAGTTVTVTAR